MRPPTMIYPDDPRYDAVRIPWNVAVDQRPAAIALPETAAEVAEVMRVAAERGLRVAPQGTGHGAGAMPALDDTVLLRTTWLNGVAVDPDTRRARTGAGVLWGDVITAAGEVGLAALHGSSPDVGVTGYSLGGGMGWYARTYGLQSNRLDAVELVTADGTHVRTDAGHDPDLFWALRGGGGNFGVVTALEFDLVPVDSAYAGMLAWDWRAAPEVLARYLDWESTAPDTVTTALRLMQLPARPEVPEPVRGRQLVVIDGAVLGTDEDGERIIAPLRELRPEIDTFARQPAAALGTLHMDPPGPTPAVSRTCTVADLPAPAVDAVLAAAGPDSGTSLLIALELRQLGGALGRPTEAASALPTVDGRFLALGIGIAASPELAASGEQDATRVMTALAPWTGGDPYLNFADYPMATHTAFPSDTWDQLRAVRAGVDPGGRIVANHPVPV